MANRPTRPPGNVWLIAALLIANLVFIGLSIVQIVQGVGGAFGR